MFPSKTTAGLSKIVAVLMQSVGVQALNTAFFYLISIHLTTAAFGALSWATALSLFLTTIIGFGLEQVVLRRVAAGNDTTNWAGIAFFVHSLVGSSIVLILLFIVSSLLPGNHEGIRLLPVVFCVQALALLVVPFKLLLNGRARYLPYAVIAFLSNCGRIITILLLLKTVWVSSPYRISLVMLVFMVLELIATLLYVSLTRNRLIWKVPMRGYVRLLKEASPQYLSVLFDISLARMDWILLGILSTDEATGLYSFAYRAFEILRIPTTAVGLLLMPKIAPLLQRTERLPQDQMHRVNQFFRIEIWVVSGMMLLMNVLWIPLMELITHGRYGSNNHIEAGLLSLCLPLHFAINLMWIVAFAARNYARIARITLITSLLNIGLNLILIPIMGGKGASIAFLAASIVQASMYYILLKRANMHLEIKSLIICLAVAAFSFMLPTVLGNASIVITIGLPIIVYGLGSLLLRQWKQSDIAFIKQMLGQ